MFYTKTMSMFREILSTCSTTQFVVGVLLINVSMFHEIMYVYYA